MRKRLRVLRAHGPRVYCLLFWLLYYPINSKLIQWRYTAIQYAGSISSVGCSVVVIHAVTLAHVIKAFGKGFTHHNIIAPAHSLHSTPLDVTSGGHVRYTQHHIILFFFLLLATRWLCPKFVPDVFCPGDRYSLRLHITLNESSSHVFHNTKISTICKNTR